MVRPRPGLFQIVVELGAHEVRAGRQVERVLIAVRRCRNVEASLGVGDHDVHVRIDTAARDARCIHVDRHVAGLAAQLNIRADVAVAIERPIARSAADGFQRQRLPIAWRADCTCAASASADRHQEQSLHPPVTRRNYLIVVRSLAAGRLAR